jgi:cyanuric acid amidohydrolase
MTRRAFVHRIATRGPDDTATLEAMMADGVIDPPSIVAILGKTEGNGCVNDFTRGYALRALKDALRRHLSAADAEAVCIVMSGGTEGGLSPHIVVLEVRQTDAPAEAGALCLGRARTAELPLEHLGRVQQVDSVAEAVHAAMREAGIRDAADVHFVQIKCPLLTRERVAEVEERGQSVATRDPLKSMGFSRAASALGIAVALGEVDRGRLSDEAIGRDWSLYSSRASASAGVELLDHEIIVLGSAPGWSGPLRIAHGVMRDAIDVEPVHEAFASVGLPLRAQLRGEQRGRLIALLAKAEASASGTLRGRRHTMLDDSDISATRHARGFVGGVLASLVGHAEIYVSGGAEHQGPDGGGPVAVIASKAPTVSGVAA